MAHNRSKHRFANNGSKLLVEKGTFGDEKGSAPCELSTRHPHMTWEWDIMANLCSIFSSKQMTRLLLIITCLDELPAEATIGKIDGITESDKRQLKKELLMRKIV